MRWYIAVDFKIVKEYGHLILASPCAVRNSRFPPLVPALEVPSVGPRCAVYCLHSIAARNTIFLPSPSGVANPVYPPAVSLRLFSLSRRDEQITPRTTLKTDPQGDDGNRLRPVGYDRVPRVRHAHEKSKPTEVKRSDERRVAVEASSALIRNIFDIHE